MYCQKCGHLIYEGQNFCPRCGVNVNSDNNKLVRCSKYLMVATAPIMLMLRMLTQKEFTGYGWSGAYTYYAVPDNYKVIMSIIAIGMLGTSLYLKSKRRDKSVVFGCIISAFISLFIIMIEF